MKELSTTSTAGGPPASRSRWPGWSTLEGSGPRDPGAAMAVNEDGEVIGSVSGGCVEGAVVTEALEVLERGDPHARHLRQHRRRRLRRRAHLRRHHPPLHRRLHRRDRRSPSPRRCQTGEPAALATSSRGPAPGAKLLVRPDDAGRSGRSATPTSTGSSPATPSASSRPAAPASATTASTARPAGRRAWPSSSSRSPCPPKMVIFGAIDFTAALARLGQAARLPRDRVRRPAGVRHQGALPDGRRGRRRLARPAPGARSARSSGPATPSACSPTTPSSTSRPSCRPSRPRPATSASWGRGAPTTSGWSGCEEAGLDDARLRPAHVARSGSTSAPAPRRRRRWRSAPRSSPPGRAATPPRCSDTEGPIHKR